MYEIPVDFDSLFQIYSSDLEEAMKASNASLPSVGLLCQRLILEHKVLDYKPQYPATLTGRELADFVGVSYKAFCSYVERCLAGRTDKGGYRPLPLDGGSVRCGPFRMQDAQTLLRNRTKVFTRYKEVPPEEHKGKRPPLVFRPLKILDNGYRDFLLGKVAVLLNSPGYEKYFRLPRSVPQNETDLYFQYRKMVANFVYKRTKYGITYEDALGDVWKKVLSSNILRKFTQKGAKRLPVTMTGLEARDYLGISDYTWLRLCSLGKAPKPVQGRVRSLNALFKTKDILKLDEDNPFRCRPWLRRLPESAATGPQLTGYLKLTVANALANVFRTRDRRYNKETTLGNTVLRDNGDHYKPQVTQLEQPPAWQDTLESKDASAEDLYDFHNLACLMGVQYDTPEFQEMVPLVLKKIQTTLAGAPPEKILRELPKLAEPIRRKVQMRLEVYKASIAVA